MNKLSLLGVSLLVLLGSACSGNNSGAGTLSDNVGESFSGCNESEIKFLSAKHNFQVAFRPCGNNTFSAYRWSPDGRHIYFQLVMSSYIMDANSAAKSNMTVPTPSPVAEAAWLTTSRIALPVVSAEANDETHQMAIFQMPEDASAEGGVTTAGELAYHALEGLRDITDVHRGDSPNDVLFSARPADGDQLNIYKMDAASGEFAPAFPWLEAPFTHFTYSASQKRVVLSHEGTTKLLHAETGEEMGSWDNAVLGALHGDGRWLLLEFEGPPISVYFQRTWDELSDQARRRELARAERFADGLPEWSTKDVRPPSISVVDLETEKRWAFTAFQGDHVQWYEGNDTYVSFFLWGFEGKQLKRNVALGNLADRLEAIKSERTMMGVVPFEAALQGAVQPEAAEPTDAATE